MRVMRLKRKEERGKGKEKKVGMRGMREDVEWEEGKRMRRKEGGECERARERE